MNSLLDAVCPNGCAIDPAYERSIRAGRQTIAKSANVLEFVLLKLRSDRDLIHKMIFKMHDCVLLRWLIRNGMSIKSLEAQDWSKRTALHRAVDSGCLCLVKTIAENYPGLMLQQDRAQAYALHIAIVKRPVSLPIMRCLLRNGAFFMPHDDRNHNVLAMVAPKQGEGYDVGDKDAFVELLEAGCYWGEYSAPWLIRSIGQTVICDHVPFYIACGPYIPNPSFPLLLKNAKHLREDERALFYALASLKDPQAVTQPIDADAMRLAKTAVSYEQLGFVKRHAIDICFGLQEMQLPAFITLQIIDFSWGVVSELVPMHLKWRLVTLVKHFHKPKDEEEGME